jgi:hypothetical protein
MYRIPIIIPTTRKGRVIFIATVIALTLLVTLVVAAAT